MASGDGVKGLQALEGSQDKANLMVSHNYEICNFFFFPHKECGDWRMSHMTCLQPLKLKKKSKLLVSVAKEVVFLDEPDKTFKRFPIYWFRKI